MCRVKQGIAKGYIGNSNMIISILLIMLGAVALYLGIRYIFKDVNDKIMGRCLSVYGILVFMWCFGYGVMGLCKSIERCYFWRAVALFGVTFYLIIIFIFVRHFTGLLKKGFYPVIVFSGFFAAVSFYFVIQRSVVDFFEYNGRMAYSGQPSFARTLQGIYIVYMMVLTVSLGIITYRRSEYKRTKRAIVILIIAHFAIVLFMIPDTIFPMMGMVSMPTTGIAAFIAYLCFIYITDNRSIFSLTASSINRYIYNYTKSSILFFGLDGKLLAANDFAGEYLNIADKKGISYRDIFDVERGDLENIIAGKNEEDDEIGIKIKNVDKKCSASVVKIYDSFGDPIYYGCILNDITDEAKKYEETAEMKERLDAEVKEKTKEIEKLSLETIETMANALEAKDEYTKGHSLRVSQYSEILAKSAGFSEEEVENIRVMALLHDVGKISIPDRVLNKAGRLEDGEFEIIKSHTIQGDALLKGISYLGPVAQIARHHHERFDGKGYPDKISGEEIEIEARIVGIADSFDAMSSDRVYRRALPNSIIREELIKGRGTQFDPKLLDIFLKLFDEGALDKLRPKSAEEKFIFNINDFIDNIDIEGLHEGAGVLSHDELVKIYSYLKERKFRYGSSFKAALITLECENKENINSTHLEKAMTAMEYSIIQHLRKTDLTSRVSPTQMMVILTEADEDYIFMIMDRIFSGYYKNCLYSEFKLRYEIND